jgi:hypothetical protein
MFSFIVFHFGLFLHTTGLVRSLVDKIPPTNFNVYVYIVIKNNVGCINFLQPAAPEKLENDPRPRSKRDDRYNSSCNNREGTQAPQGYNKGVK